LKKASATKVSVTAAATSASSASSTRLSTASASTLPQAPVLAKKIDLTTVRCLGLLPCVLLTAVSQQVTSGLFRLEQVDRASLQALKNNGYEFEYFDPGHDSLLCGIDDNGHITDVTSQSWRHRTHADEHQARRARWDDTVKMTTTTLNSTDVDGLQQALHERIINWTTLWSHYGELKLRRLAFSAHVTRQRARDQIANCLFGRDRQTILFIGDQATRTGYRGPCDGAPRPPGLHRHCNTRRRVSNICHLLRLP